MTKLGTRTKTIFRRLQAISGCGILCLGMLSAQPGWAAPDLQRLAQDDPRLRQKINVRAPRVYIGDLLAAVSAATGVKLVPGYAGDGTADFQVAACLNEVRLSDFMEALWSLGSHKGAEWAWTPQRPEQGEVSYRLWRPLRARQLPSDLRNQIQIDFEQQTEKLLALAGTDAAVRAGAQEDFPLARSIGPETRLGLGLVLIRTHVTEEQLRSVLRGGPGVSVPVSALNSDGRRFVDNVWAQAKPHRRNADGSLEPHPQPDIIRLYCPDPRAEGTPSLYLELGPAGGYAYAGGTPLRSAWEEKLKNLWLLPGDQATSPILEQPLKPAPARHAPEREEKPFPAAERLNSTALASGFSYLALLPRNQRDPGDGKGLRLEQLLEKVPRTFRKFRRDVLLISYMGWFTKTGEPGNVPWMLHDSIAQRIRKRNGLLELSDLCQIAARFPSSANAFSSPLTRQLYFLAMPDVSYLLARCFHDRSFEARLRAGKVTLAELRSSARALGGLQQAMWQKGDPTSRLRLTEQSIKATEAEDQRQVMFLVQTPEDPLGSGSGFRFKRIDAHPTDLTVSVVKEKSSPPALR